MGKKRIRIIIGSLNVGGTEKQLVQILNGLYKNNWNIEIIVINNRGRLTKLLNKNIKIQCIGSKSFFKILLPIKYIFSLYKIFKKNPQTLTHFFLPQSYILGMFASILAKTSCKLIMSRRSLNNYQKKFFLYRKIEKFLHKKVNKILVNSSAIKKQLIKDEDVKNKKIKLIYNGIEIKKIKKIKSKTKKQFNISIVANLIPYKCHDILLKSLNLIKNELPVNWKLYCIGRNDGIKKNLLKLCKKYKIENNVVWLETINIEQTLESSNLGILCSSEEGFPNAILEYFAAKLPVISTNVGGCREIIKNKKNGFLVPKHNPQKLSKAIIFFYKNQYIGKKYGNAGFKLVKEKFDIKKTIKEHEKIYLNM